MENPWFFLEKKSPTWTVMTRSWPIKPNFFGIPCCPMLLVKLSEARLLGGTLAAGKHRRGHLKGGTCAAYSARKRGTRTSSQHFQPAETWLLRNWMWLNCDGTWPYPWIIWKIHCQMAGLLLRPKKSTQWIHDFAAHWTSTSTILIRSHPMMFL